MLETATDTQVMAADAALASAAAAATKKPNQGIALRTEAVTGQNADNVLSQLTDRLGKIGAELSHRLSSFGAGAAAPQAALATMQEEAPAMEEPPRTTTKEATTEEEATATKERPVTTTEQGAPSPSATTAEGADSATAREDAPLATTAEGAPSATAQDGAPSAAMEESAV